MRVRADFACALLLMRFGTDDYGDNADNDEGYSPKSVHLHRTTPPPPRGDNISPSPVHDMERLIPVGFILLVVCWLCCRSAARWCVSLMTFSACGVRRRPSPFPPITQFIRASKSIYLGW